nr:MAG TPA_asm: hypothetical protein [Caudoviricetes sp.]
MTRTIPLKIQNEYIAGDKVLIGAAGSHNDVVLRMEFSPMWDGLAKTVQFCDALGENVVQTLLTANLLETGKTNVYLVAVPGDAKKYAGRMAVAIKGAATSAQKETRATMAAYGTFKVAESNWNETEEVNQDVPASQAEQLQSQIDAILDNIQDARSAAGEAASSASSAAGSASQAKNSAAAAAKSSSAAAASAANAANSIVRTPYIGSNKNWYVWNSKGNKYVDTGVYAVGADGATMPASGLFGFDVDLESGQLRLYYTGDTPPDFSLDADGHLIYKLSPDVSVDIGVVKGADGDTTLDITGASVGQVARVQEVDSDGRPIKWEAASVSAGVGEIYDESSGISVRYPEKMTIQVAQASRWGRLVQVVLQITTSEDIPVNYGWIATLPRIATTRVWLPSTVGNDIFFVNAGSAQINCNRDVFPAGASMLFGTYLTNENVEGVTA